LKYVDLEAAGSGILPLVTDLGSRSESSIRLKKIQKSYNHETFLAALHSSFDNIQLQDVNLWGVF
jgi:hypothetical protein